MAMLVLPCRGTPHGWFSDQEEMEGKVLEYMRRANWSCHSWGWTIGNARIEGWDDYPVYLEPGENLKTIRHLGWNEFVCNRNLSNPPCHFLGVHTHTQLPVKHSARAVSVKPRGNRIDPTIHRMSSTTYMVQFQKPPSKLLNLKKGRQKCDYRQLILVLNALGPKREVNFAFGIWSLWDEIGIEFWWLIELRGLLSLVSPCFSHVDPCLWMFLFSYFMSAF